MMKRIAFVFVASLAAACGGAGQPCTPGMSIVCACSDGSMGAQVCQSDGTFAACSCTHTTTHGGGGSGGSGGSGGTGGNGGTVIDMGGTSPSGDKRVFVTSLAYASSAAPTVCQNVAKAAYLGGTWVPWLSGYNKSAISSIMGTGPWKRVDGQLAFANAGQLATEPSVPLNVTETGTTLASGDTSVWTGTLTGGTNSGYDCNDWTSGNSYDTWTGGNAGATVGWTDNGGHANCNLTAHVYCFEQ